MFTDIHYQLGGLEFKSKFLKPEGDGPFPVVLVAPDWSGLNNFALKNATTLRDHGYAALAIDIYGDGQVYETKEAKADAMAVLMEDRRGLRERLQAAYQAAKGVANSKTKP